MAQTHEQARPTTDPPAGVERLRGMSTTAGLGHEYAEANAWAVFAAVAAVIGLAAIIVPLALFVPAAALLAAGVAVVQIRRAGGTQTGLPLAIGAGVLSAVVLFFGLINVVGGTVADRGEAARIDAYVEQLGSLLAVGDADAAYDLTHPAFKAGVDSETWKKRFRAFRRPGEELLELDTSGAVNLERVGGTDMAETMLLFRQANRDQPRRFAATFAKSDGDWRLAAVPDIFPVQGG